LIYQCRGLRNLLPARGTLLPAKFMLLIIIILIMLHFDKNPMGRGMYHDTAYADNTFEMLVVLTTTSSVKNMEFH
jgi:hypothetical protein